MGDSEVAKSKPFYRTLPAILTSATGLIVAVTALLYFLWPAGLPERGNPRADAGIEETDLEPTYDPSVVFHEARGHWDQVEL